MERYWINAPSTLQPVHHLHGANVLCNTKDRIGSCVTVYFVEGDVASALIPALYLSKGWR